ncbi:MAG: Adventurous gliding motility protein [Labilithrix sp.]|nr:Adventurous gliding motility protein [Labilithrix sp.]
MRNLEQIQENDGEGSTPRGVTMLLVALGGACIVFAGFAITGKRSTEATAKVDPLGELVTQQARIGGAAPGPRATDLSTREVTFPGLLSDESAPTTALAAVKGNPKPAASASGAVAAAPPADPTAAIALNVRSTPASEGLGAPLPAQNMLGASPVVTRPRDSLTRAASDAAESQSSSAGPPAPPGREGGYQLQVSSFRTQSEADGFSGQLRARGHKAYVVEAHVPGRGTWFRVRIGPFANQHAAASYRSGFEGREHVVPFIVPPAK